MANVNDWIEKARAQGWDHVLSALLDAFEPFAPLGAQALWVMQPALNLFVSRDALNELAQTLEAPDGIARLREQLMASDPPGG